MDASASMGEVHRSAAGQRFVKLEAVKRSLLRVLTGRFFPPSARLAVLSFHAPTRAAGLLVKAEEFSVISPLKRAGELRSSGELGQRLEKIALGGATPTGNAISIGLELLYSSEDTPYRRVKKLILVTDERSNVGPKPKAVVDEKVGMKAIIDIVAIGSKTDRGEMSEICRATGGVFFEVDNEPELVDALKPRIADFDLGKDTGLLAEARQLHGLLEAERSQNLLERGWRLRSALESRLRETRILLPSARGEFGIRASELLAKQRLPMKDYEEAVRGAVAELGTLELLEEELLGAISLLPGENAVQER